MSWLPFAWFAAALFALLLLERWIHRHMQGVALLLVGESRQDLAVWLYALPLLPGVILHEMSHALAGLAVGARVGRISILPARSEGRIQLGFVPVEATGPVRTAIIGLAPLVAGCLALLLIGTVGLDLAPLGRALAARDWSAVEAGLVQAINARSFWIWAYLVFSISNTMLPSRSDMRAWPVVLIFLVGVAALVALLGLGAALVAPLSDALQLLAIACILTILVDLPFVLLILGGEWILSRIRGVRVDYRKGRKP